MHIGRGGYTSRSFQGSISAGCMEVWSWMGINVAWDGEHEASG